jgi:hypothetical protein
MVARPTRDDNNNNNNNKSQGVIFMPASIGKARTREAHAEKLELMTWHLALLP